MDRYSGPNYEDADAVIRVGFDKLGSTNRTIRSNAWRFVQTQYQGQKLFPPEATAMYDYVTKYHTYPGRAAVSLCNKKSWFLSMTPEQQNITVHSAANCRGSKGR